MWHDLKLQGGFLAVIVSFLISASLGPVGKRWWERGFPAKRKRGWIYKTMNTGGIVWLFKVITIEKLLKMVEWYLPILSVMVNIALDASRHIISGIFRKFTPHTRAMDRFSDLVSGNINHFRQNGSVPFLD